MPARRRAPAHRVHQHRERDRALAVRLINEYKATEDALKASGLDYTILRNGYYLDIPPDTMAEELRGQMSPPEIELMLGIATSIRHGEADCPTADLETLIGRAPTGLDEFLVYAAPAA